MAYLPNQILVTDFGRGFYIPSGNTVEESFGVSLRKIFGSKEGCSHWADAIKWSTIKNRQNIENRIEKGVFEITSGDSDYQTIFEGYFSSLSARFEHTWIYGKGDFYRFREGKHKEASEKFEAYWNQKEKEQWKTIHRFMREYTLKQAQKD